MHGFVNLRLFFSVVFTQKKQKIVPRRVLKKRETLLEENLSIHESFLHAFVMPRGNAILRAGLP